MTVADILLGYDKSYLKFYQYRRRIGEFLAIGRRLGHHVAGRVVETPEGEEEGPGGALPYMGYIGMCRCEGYGFQAVYSRIGYINQSVWV